MTFPAGLPAVLLPWDLIIAGAGSDLSGYSGVCKDECDRIEDLVASPTVPYHD